MRVARPGLVVAVAILLSLPMAPDILDGAIAPTTALLRFLLALLLCWAGAAVVGTVLRRYSAESRRTELARMVEEARRRAADQARPPSEATEEGAAGPSPG